MIIQLMCKIVIEIIYINNNFLNILFELINSILELRLKTNIDGKKHAKCLVSKLVNAIAVENPIEIKKTKYVKTFIVFLFLKKI